MQSLYPRATLGWRNFLVLAVSASVVSACSLLSPPHRQPPPPPAPAAAPKPVGSPPLATHRFEFDPQTDDVVGVVQKTIVGKDDTLPDIARRFNLGYEEILRANPGVDPWLPGAGREIVLPTRFVLPAGPREGVVINVPAMRFFYFPKPKKGERGNEKAIVITHPIGIGKVGWSTPEGSTKVLKRTKDPTWTVPASVRKEHEENGDPLPKVVPPGPDNPLGAYSFTLGWPSYLIHGTNKPYGVGMRSSHGCIRLYPEDIEILYDTLPVGTKITVVNQPFVFGRDGRSENNGRDKNAVVMQPFGVLEDDKREWQKSHRKLLEKTLSPQIRKALEAAALKIDWARVETLAAESRGVPVSVTAAGASVESVLAGARKVQNVLPKGATWDGKTMLDEDALNELLSDREPGSQTNEAVRDAHSYGNPQQLRVEHVDLALQVDFKAKRLDGTAELRVRRVEPQARKLILDTRDLEIRSVELLPAVDAAQEKAAPVEVPFQLGARDEVLGSALEIQLPAELAGDTVTVRVGYRTRPQASGLQWLEPAQTAGKRKPFLFTQSQAIHARSWIPLQDSPGVRLTYAARIRAPKDLRAVMSAEQDAPAAGAKAGGEYRFHMPQAIAPYLIALAVGDIAFKPLSARTGVYAEPSVLEGAATELADTEKMVETTERLYGPYRWGRYDILVLPPSFPFGGMENPRLTFATPTILAGDKSLVSLIAHELAHSWSGNLVTNATWRDFWLNEGFTVYLERRIVEAVYGRPREEMEAVLGLQGLQKELAELDDRDEILHIDLAGRDPDAGFTGVPYEKGALFLRQLEETFGRERFDRFLKGYFNRFAFQSITTADFLAYLQRNLLEADPRAAAKVPVEEWITKPGLPASAPRPVSDAFDKVDAARQAWLAGGKRAADLPAARWSTHEWLHFLDNMPERLTPAQLAELDAAFQLTKTGNSEIAHSWLRIAVRNHYEPALPRLETYLTTIGRRKLIKPLYEDLMKSDWGREFARRVYAKARPGYHPIAVVTLDEIVR